MNKLRFYRNIVLNRKHTLWSEGHWVIAHDRTDINLNLVSSVLVLVQLHSSVALLNSSAQCIVLIHCGCCSSQPNISVNDNGLVQGREAA